VFGTLGRLADQLPSLSDTPRRSFSVNLVVHDQSDMDGILPLLCDYLSLRDVANISFLFRVQLDNLTLAYISQHLELKRPITRMSTIHRILASKNRCFNCARKTGCKTNRGIRICDCCRNDEDGSFFMVSRIFLEHKFNPSVRRRIQRAVTPFVTTRLGKYLYRYSECLMVV